MDATAIRDPSLDLYTSRKLRLYDPVVLSLSNRLIWRCPRRHLLDHYNRHLGATHLDIGPGTGWFLAHARFPVLSPAVTLLDANEAVLTYASRRLRHLQPTSIQADLRWAVDLPPGAFASIGLNYVLHCIPEPFASKARMLADLRPLLASSGVVFGSTILASGVHHSPLSRAVQASYNRRGWFGNRDDTIDDLDGSLASTYPRYEISVRGAVALFAAWNV